MKRVEGGLPAIHTERLPFEVEAEFCSICGKNSRNEDYALYEQNVGMCVADGIGGAPLGDAVARYACHVAMEALRSGESARNALEEAARSVARFINTVDSPRSGTSLAIARLTEDTLDVAWAGDTAVFVFGHGDDETPPLSSLDNSRFPPCAPLGSRCLEKTASISLPLNDVESVVLCTDGAWRGADLQEIGKLLSEGELPRATAAKIVFGHQSNDDSTALVARIRATSIV